MDFRENRPRGFAACGDASAAFMSSMLAGGPNILQMCSSFEANKSTKGASKLRRDLINAEISNLRDLLPLPSSTRQRLSQLQLMALVCVYERKANYFQHIFRKHDVLPEVPLIHFGFSKEDIPNTTPSMDAKKNKTTASQDKLIIHGVSPPCTRLFLRRMKISRNAP